MGYYTLSRLQKKQYKEIVRAFDGEKTIELDEKNYIRLREILGILQHLGYIKDLGIDNTNMFLKVGDFSDFDEWHKDKEREERKISAREWTIGIIGALIGLIPFFITTVIPGIVSLFQE